MKARALYDFDADDSEEISFIAGDVIKITLTDKDTQDGWWKGQTKTSKEGFFPSTYVEVIPEDEEASQEAIEAEGEGQEEPESLSFARSVEEVESKRITLVMEGIRGVRGIDSEQLTQVIKEKMNKQIAEWKSQEEEEWIQQKNSGGGSGSSSSSSSNNNNSSGINNNSNNNGGNSVNKGSDRKEVYAPTNYDFQSKKPNLWTQEDVRNWLIHMSFSDFFVLVKDHQIAGSTLLSLDHAGLRKLGARVIGRRVKLLNSVEVLKEQEPRLQDELKGLTSVVSSESLRNLGDSSEDDNDPSRELAGNQVRAIADFLSQKKEELVFKKGDVITLVEKTNTEWWWGEFKGKVGLFPRSHVTGGNFDADPSGDHPVPGTSLASSVLSGIDAVSPQGVQSAKNRKASTKDINLSLRQSRKVRGKLYVAPVPEIQAQEISRPDYQGWLVKQGGSVKTWKRRWFVLKDYCLYYFKDPVDGNALGCITLPSYTITAVKEASNKKFAFQLTHSGAARTYIFIADSESEMTLWMRALTTAALGKPLLSTSSKPTSPSYSGPPSTTTSAPPKAAPALTPFPSSTSTLPTSSSSSSTRGTQAQPTAFPSLPEPSIAPSRPSTDLPFVPPANGPMKPSEPLPLPPQPAQGVSVATEAPSAKLEGEVEASQSPTMNRMVPAESIAAAAAAAALKKQGPAVLPKPKKDVQVSSGQ